MDLSDSDFQSLMVINSKRQLEGYRRLVQEAIGEGELLGVGRQ